MSLLEKIIRRHTLLSNGDPLFAKFLGCQLMGNILSKNSYVSINPKPKRFNLYLCLVAKSYWGRKGVAQDMHTNYYPPDMILPNESSAEQFLRNLSQTPNGIWMYGEISKLLKHIKKGGYLTDIIEVLNDLHNYERPRYIRNTLKYTSIIDNPYPCFCASVTEEVLRDVVTPEMLDGGFFSKIILVPGKPGEASRRSAIPQEAFDLDKEITQEVLSLYKKNITMTFTLDSTATDKFFDLESKAQEKTNISSIVGRYTEDVVILAGILAFDDYLTKNSKNCINSNNSNSSINSNDNINTHITTDTILTINTIITQKHLSDAYLMIKPCIELAERLYQYSSMNRKYILKLYNYVKENYPVHRSQASRQCNLDSSEIKEAEKTLIDIQNKMKLLTYTVTKSNGVTSKPHFVYCLTNPDKTKCMTCSLKGVCAKNE